MHRILAALIVTIALLGSAGAKKAKPVKAAVAVKAEAPPLAVVCGTDEMVQAVGPVLDVLAPDLASGLKSGGQLVATEKQFGTPAFLCALTRAAALVSVNGGPQYPGKASVALLREHADAVRASTNAILAKYRFVLKPIESSRKEPSKVK